MKWMTVEDKMPKSYKDYLVLGESGYMEVCFGWECEYGTFEWYTIKDVLFYSKLPNRPNGFSMSKMKKELDIKLEKKKHEILESGTNDSGIQALMNIFK